MSTDPDIANDDNEDTPGPDLTALERRLSAWRPAGALDRDRMLYEAGRAAAGVRAWRLGTAALVLVLVGLGGLTAFDRVQLARERALLAQERSRLKEVETALAARMRATRPVPMSPAPGPASAPAEPPAPDSYLVLTSRLAGGIAGISWPDDARPASPDGTSIHPAEPSPRPVPLAPDDVRRILDL